MITPDNVVAPFVLGIQIAPLPTPVPLNEKGSATVSVPTIFTAAPELTVVEPAAVPNAAALLTLIAPLLTVVKPVYVFAPVNANVSLPIFVNLPSPLITPSIFIALIASAVKVYEDEAVFIPPVIVNISEAVPVAVPVEILLEEPKVIVPDNVFEPVVLLMAPREL